MINLSKSGNTIVFEFTDNGHYLQNGTIEVPVNSLSLVIDDSNMVTMRKSASNDIFISGTLEEFGMTKAELEAWYKENMVGATGGGGVTPEEVQTLIDENISGITDDIDDIELAVAGAVNDLNDRIDDLSGNSITSGDVQNAISGKVDTTVYTAYTAATDSALSGKQKTIEAGRGISLTTGATADTVSLGFPISAGTGVDSLLMSGSGNTASGDFSVAYGKLNTVSGECGVVMGNRNTSNNFAEFAIGQKNVSRTEDASAFGHSGNTLFSVGNGIINEEQGIDANHNAFEVRGNGEIYISDTNAAGSYYQKPMINLQDTLNGKQDTLSAGTNITISGNVISAEGGGKAIEAGRGIAITTGETADTINCTLPISAGSSNSSVSIGQNNRLGTSVNSAAIGKTNNIGNISRVSLVVGENNSVEYNLNCAFAFGYGSSAKTSYTFANGLYTIAKNQGELSTGKYNVSSSASTTFGNSGNTLFSVGNGTADNARHNAFEIRQNGDIYISSGGTDIKLQDNLGGGIPESAFTAYTAATDSRLSEDEEVTAAALNNINDRLSEDEEVTAAGLNAVNSALGGLKLQQITQSAYDALVTKDASTLYIIVN